MTEYSRKSSALFFGYETTPPLPLKKLKKVGAKRGPYGSGERKKASLAKRFPGGVPSEEEMPDPELVRCVQAKHDELYRNATAPSCKTILKYAGRE